MDENDDHDDNNKGMRMMEIHVRMGKVIVPAMMRMSMRMRMMTMMGIMKMKTTIT